MALQQDDLITRPGVDSFLVALRSVIEFLHSIDDNSVRLYSYERTPSIDSLVNAFGNGAGADDSALEEVGKKGQSGRKALLSFLKKEQDKRRIMSAISMLLIVFRDDRTIAAIQKFIDACEPDIGKEASLLMTAYTAK